MATSSNNKRILIITLPASCGGEGIGSQKPLKLVPIHHQSNSEHKSIKFDESIIHQDLVYLPDIESSTTVVNDESIIYSGKEEIAQIPLPNAKYVETNCYSSDRLNVKDSRFSFVQSLSKKPPVLKRQRLTHLTAEEKLRRRKFKNRLAAHLARERRKIFVGELDHQYKRLRYENDGLKSRNHQMKTDLEKLQAENEALKARLASNNHAGGNLPKVTNVAQSSEIVGSAASINGPQQQVRILARAALTWLACLASMVTTTVDCLDSQQTNHQVEARTEALQRKWSLVLETLNSLSVNQTTKEALLRKLEILKQTLPYPLPVK